MKVSFSLPRHTKLVYFGRIGHGILRNYITEDDYVVYENPRERLNLWVALRMLISGRRSESAYYRAFLRLYRPQVVITMEDNNITFYATKTIHPSCKTIAVQNGVRNTMSHSADSSFRSDLQRMNRDGYDADVIVTQGGLGSLFYRSALPNTRVQLVEAGHVMNNALSAQSSNNVASRRRVVFISKYPNRGSSGDDSGWDSDVVLYIEKTPLTAARYYAIESIVARVCAQVASELSVPFVVLGKRPKWQVGEYNFFSKHLSGFDWEYSPSDNQASSYETVTESDIIVNVDSTLGYELFSRGLRVVFAAARMRAAGQPHIVEYQFGYPLVAEDRGPYWTNEPTADEIRRVLTFALETSAEEWSRTTQPVRDLLFRFDPGNTLLCRVLDDAGVANTGPRSWTRELIPAN